MNKKRYEYILQRVSTLVGEKQKLYRLAKEQEFNMLYGSDDEKMFANTNYHNFIVKVAELNASIDRLLAPVERLSDLEVSNLKS